MDLIIRDITIDEFSDLDHEDIGWLIGTGRVDEIRQGRWVLDENPHDGDCRCSVCWMAIDAMNERNHEMLNILTGGKWWTFYNYCPNCGARMVNKEE